MTRPEDGEIARILAGDGPIGVLGPVAGWPPELRSTMDLLMGSTHPLAVCWGPDFALLYNDAYVPGAGRKHPEGFGAPVRAVWPEIWARIGPLLERVVRTGEPQGRQDDRLVMYRHGFAEETYWNYSFSPLRTADGRVAGVFNITSETTRRVVGERRLRLLARLAEAGRDAGSVERVLQQVAAVLDTAQWDVPFAALYRHTPDREGPRLVAAAGFGDRVPDLPAPGAVGFTMVELPGGLVSGRGVRSTVAASAVVAGADGGPALGVLLGVPPALPFDADQRSFLQLVVDHVAAAVAAAGAAEARGRRAAAMTELERARTGFIAGFGEEFRTPLAMILGPVEQLRDRVPPDLRADVDVLERNAARMLKLVDDLLEVSRLEAGRVAGAFVPVDLGAVTGELAGLFRSTAERAGLILDIDCPPLPRPVWVDPELWEKVVLNLLSNAVKHTFDGGVRVEVSADGEHAELRVIDTGVGIPEEELDRLFDRFHRVRGVPSRSAEGSGIGLALVRQAVELHGGTVEVTSTVDIGSVFIVRLPLGLAHLPVDALGPAPEPGPRSASEIAEPFLAEARRWLPGAEPDEPAVPELLSPSGAPGGRVLVADGDPDIRAYIARLLSEHWEVQVVADGAQVLAAAAADPPDMIVADVALPGPDDGPGGLGLVRALRADPTTAGVPVVLVSASAGEEAAVQGLAAGADDYLVKPFSARELVARVGSHLQLGRTRRAAERRFRAMADATPALIWVDDASGERQFVNRGWLDFTGTADAAVELGRAWQDRIHPDDRKRYRSVREAATTTGAAFEVEYRLRHASGHHRWVLDRGAPVSPDEHPTGFVGGCLDVDAQHRERRRNLLFAEVATALDAERSAVGRFRALARTLVEHGVADLARVHEHRAEGTPALRAVAAADPGAEPALRSFPGDLGLLGEVAATGRARLVVTGPDHPLDVGSGVVAPLVAGGRVLGLVALDRTVDRVAFDAEDLDLVVEIGRRAGVAVDNARLLEQERAASQRLALLHRATARMSAAVTSEEVAAIAADHLATLLGCRFVGVWSAAGDGPLRLIARHGWTDQVPRSWDHLSRRADIPASRAYRARQPIWIPDEGTWLRTDARTWPVVSGAGMVALGFVPLLVGDRCLGVVGVGFAGPHDFADDEREAAVAAVELAAQALDRADLFRAETSARRAAERLSAVATALSRAVGLDAVAQVAVTHAVAGTRARSAVVLLVGDGGQLQPMAVEGYDPEEAPGDLPSDADHPLWKTLRTGEPMWTAGGDQDVYPVHKVAPLLVGGRAIGVLGLRFDTAPAYDEYRRAVVLTLAGQCAQAVARAQLHQTEHEMAVVLQRSLLPQQLPALDRLALAPRYLPGTAGTEAGGDWYDVLELPDGGRERIALVVGDVVGRGPAAAAVMGQLRSALAANLVNGQGPAGALEQLDLFARRVTGARASTVACAVLDLGSGELRYACAGHPPPLVVGTDGAVRRLTEGRGTPLGVTGRPPYAEAADHLEPGATVLLCSDGLFERRNEVVDRGLDRLAAVLGELDGPPEEVADELLDRMIADRSAPDDVAFVLARLLPGPLRLRLAAEPEQLGVLRRAVGAWCQMIGMGEGGLTDLQLALGEAVTNSVEHAYLGAEPAGVDVELDRLPGGAVDVRVRDSGHWRPPPEDPGFRGRGLSLIRDIAEELAVEPGPDGTTVRFRVPAVPLDAPPGSRFPSPAHPSEPVEEAPAPLVGASLRRRTGSDGVRLHVDGDLDLAGVADVRAELLAELGRSGTVTLVLGRECWVSSAGIALLAELARSADRPVRVHTPEGSPARRMLALAGLDRVLQVEADAVTAQ
ncbi:SpoIIE family protein phosphatase [Pseudonocardia humida]|uniref:histidine kinase n=1 Tax=Pseudonocardia humida TaxID=2800819 RepID=A0ABT1A2U7_9PSEU|nr:SpoIIE family protein phosphatase [Pseudonocardia humida]MCO1657194.1 SpoIIE family protein phosphatase [Pseudonocardia humida]